MSETLFESSSPAVVSTLLRIATESDHTMIMTFNGKKYEVVVRPLEETT
jgi:hypothetical protein